MLPQIDLQACICAKELRLYAPLTIHDTVIPMLVCDKLPIAEEYILGSTEFQQQSVKYLDSIVLNNPVEQLTDYARYETVYA